MDDSPNTGTDATSTHRTQGIELGALAAELESHDYPTTTDELVAAYGDYVLEMPDGSQSLAEVFDVLSADDEQFESPESVREAIFLAAGSEAVGRETYSDRGGTVQNDGETL